MGVVEEEADAVVLELRMRSGIWRSEERCEIMLSFLLRRERGRLSLRGRNAGFGCWCGGVETRWLLVGFPGSWAAAFGVEGI